MVRLHVGWMGNSCVGAVTGSMVCSILLRFEIPFLCLNVDNRIFFCLLVYHGVLNQLLSPPRHAISNARCAMSDENSFAIDRLHKGYCGSVILPDLCLRLCFLGLQSEHLLSQSLIMSYRPSDLILLWYTTIADRWCLTALRRVPESITAWQLASTTAIHYIESLPLLFALRRHILLSFQDKLTLQLLLFSLLKAGFLLLRFFCGH